jgi:hypothetical protein
VPRTFENFPIGAREPLLFMHIPKTAGTSLRQYLANQYGRAEICPASNWQDLAKMPLPQIGSYKLLQGHFGFNARSIACAGSKTLVTLREPISRTLSNIRHMQRDPTFHKLHGQVKGKTITEILGNYELRRFFANAQTTFLSANRQAPEVVAYLAADWVAMRDPADIEEAPDLNHARHVLDSIDFVGLAESLTDVLNELSVKMHFHPAVLIPHVNESQVRSDPSSITALEHDLLVECNDLDIKLYAYARELSETRRALAIHATTGEVLETLCRVGIYRRMRKSFELDLSDRLPGSGWYGPDCDAAGIRRWTGPQRSFTLEIPLCPDSHYRVQMGVWAPEGLNVAMFTVRAASMTLPIAMTNERGGSELSFELRPEHLKSSDGLCELLFEGPPVFRPADSGKPDLRKLGVAVQYVRFTSMRDR